ncbi:uncharacterized protein LOC132065247 isoform X3 [Lycium ferocissimum]|uniref:uncharacterized protein LOC132065247 isoform X3 n=1 Tax=Lycium ferocissimum TaxID=112874 RepID=UPI0028167B18|nr:uncharacterized protein LOC132065247 isoform X3 [Lycium ferocissimum]
MDITLNFHAKSGGGESLNGRMAELGIMQTQTNSVIPFPSSSAYQIEQPIQTRAALAFLLSDKGIFFREFLLDESFLLQIVVQMLIQIHM